MKAIDYAFFELDEKATRSVKKNKNNFVSVVGETFPVSVS